MKSKIIIIALAILVGQAVFAQSGPSPWVELEFSKRITKNIKAEFNPELRFFEGFRTDCYQFEGGLTYAINKTFSLSGYYRFEKAWEYDDITGLYVKKTLSNRIAVDAKTKFDANRFDFQFRLRYTNGSDFDHRTDDKTSFLRYRVKIDYDIENSKLMPLFSVEAYHDLIKDNLEKLRYTAALNYPITNVLEAGLFYKLQNYTKANKPSVHIVGVSIGFNL